MNREAVDGAANRPNARLGHAIAKPRSLQLSHPPLVEKSAQLSVGCGGFKGAAKSFQIGFSKSRLQVVHGPKVENLGWKHSDGLMARCKSRMRGELLSKTALFLLP